MSDDALIIPIVAMMIPMVVAPTAIVMKYLKTRRAWQHTETMRAIELGQYPPPQNSFWPSLAAISIGAVVPVASFGIAWLSALTDAAGEEVFVGATIVSVVSVVTGARLASQLLHPAPAPRPSAHAMNGQKSTFDPDAYDIVSRRG